MSGVPPEQGVIQCGVGGVTAEAIPVSLHHMGPSHSGIDSHVTESLGTNISGNMEQEHIEGSGDEEKCFRKSDDILDNAIKSERKETNVLQRISDPSASSPSLPNVKLEPPESFDELRDSLESTDSEGFGVISEDNALTHVKVENIQHPNNTNERQDPASTTANNKKYNPGEASVEVTDKHSVQKELNMELHPGWKGIFLPSNDNRAYCISQMDGDMS